MAIVSFWSNGIGESGKSAALAAVATFLAVQHNYKILILDTKLNDYFYQDCYWREDSTLKVMHSHKTRVNIGSGISGLAKAILSNKTSPEIVTNYTKAVFSNNGLEVLFDSKVTKEDYENNKKIFKSITKIASKYYDLVFVDIDTSLDEDTKNSLLEISDLIIVNLSQKKRQIDNYIEIKKKETIFQQKTVMPILSRYDKNSKYSAKNVSRYMREKETMSVIPYNTLFFECCCEGEVDGFFIKFRKINAKDKNSAFIEEVKKTADRIIYKLQELQMRM